jgi:hypothetical protein
MIDVRCPGCRRLLMKIWHSGRYVPLKIVTVCKHCPKLAESGERARVAITFQEPPGGRGSIPSVAMVKEEFQQRFKTAGE